MKLTLRQLLYPVIILAYRLDSKDNRGGFLVPFHHLNPTEDSLEIHFGRLIGWRYGSFRIETKTPRISLDRKDGVRWEHDLSRDTESALEITAEGFRMHRPGQPPFVLCQYKRTYAFQIALIWSRMPAEIKTRLRFPNTEPPAS